MTNLLKADPEMGLTMGVITLSEVSENQGRASDTCLGFCVWATLSKPNFNLHLDTFDGGDQEGLGPWFGWFSNRLKGYPDTLNLKCHVMPREGRNRPKIDLEPTAHPLAIEQREGITFDRVLEIYALNGHDLRTALSN